MDQTTSKIGKLIEGQAFRDAVHIAVTGHTVGDEVKNTPFSCSC